MIVIPAAAMDFADGAQRFNWCNCQPAEAKAAGLGSATLFDFDWWSGQFAAPAPAPPALPSAPSLQSVLTSPLVLAAGAAVLYFMFKGGARGAR